MTHNPSTSTKMSYCVNLCRAQINIAVSDRAIIEKLGTTPSTMIKEIVFQKNLTPSQPVETKDDSKSGSTTDTPEQGTASGKGDIEAIDIGSPMLQ